MQCMPFLPRSPAFRAIEACRQVRGTQGTIAVDVQAKKCASHPKHQMDFELRLPRAPRRPSCCTSASSRATKRRKACMISNREETPEKQRHGL